MKQYHVKAACVSLILAFLVFAGTVAGSPEDEAAEKVFKNIQVLKGVPASQIRGMMNFISASLGVNCAHCHVLREWEKDDRPAKQAARKMLQMTFDINRASFGGKLEVNCNTCHRGSLKPSSVPAIFQGDPPDRAVKQSDSARAEPMPRVDQVLERYVQALGGRAAIDRIKSRFMKGTMVSTNRPAATVEIYGKAPNKFTVTNTYDVSTLAKEGFDGRVGWGGNLQVAHEIADQQLAKLKRDAEFFKAVDLFRQYTNLAVSGKETVNNSEAYVVEATAPDGGRERLFFDSQTGLLVRRYVESKTALGMVPFQFDYLDYRDVGGVKEAFRVRLSFPDSVQVRTFTEIKHNVEVDDSRFALAEPKQ